MIAGRQWAKAAGLDLHEFSVSADQVNHEPVDRHLQAVTRRRQHRLDCRVQRALAQHADTRHAPEARGGVGALAPAPRVSDWNAQRTARLTPAQQPLAVGLTVPGWCER